jgi:DNA-binding SARP family transcriptional activator
MAHIAIRVLGDERIVRTGEGDLSMPDAFWQLTGCLLAAPGHRMNRSRLIAQLWPDREEESAHHCLASALWRIRSRLRNDAILIAAVGDIVALNAHPKMWIDAVAFDIRARAAVANPHMLAEPTQRQRLARTLRLYLGDFLDQRDQEIIALERARLRTLYLDAMYELSMAAARADDWGAARSFATELCAAEPLREDAQRLLIEAYARCGNRALALQQFRICEALLAKELAVEPMAETRALAASLLDRHSPELAPDLPALGYRATLTAARISLVQTLQIIDRALSLD